MSEGAISVELDHTVGIYKSNIITSFACRYKSKTLLILLLWFPWLFLNGTTPLDIECAFAAWPNWTFLTNKQCITPRSMFICCGWLLFIINVWSIRTSFLSWNIQQAQSIINAIRDIGMIHDFHWYCFFIVWIDPGSTDFFYPYGTKCTHCVLDKESGDITKTTCNSFFKGDHVNDNKGTLSHQILISTIPIILTKEWCKRKNIISLHIAFDQERYIDHHCSSISTATAITTNTYARFQSQQREEEKKMHASFYRHWWCRLFTIQLGRYCYSVHAR